MWIWTYHISNRNAWNGLHQTTQNISWWLWVWVSLLWPWNPTLIQCGLQVWVVWQSAPLPSILITLNPCSMVCHRTQEKNISHGQDRSHCFKRSNWVTMPLSNTGCESMCYGLQPDFWNWKLFATEIKPIKWKLKNNICITPTIDKLSLVALLKTATAATANQISATLPNTNLQVSLLNPYSLPISSHIYIANMFRNLHMNKLDSNTACGSWLGHLFNASPKNQLIRNENIQTKKC